MWSSLAMLPAQSLQVHVSVRTRIYMTLYDAVGKSVLQTAKGLE